MRIQVLSDTHFEFHRDGGQSFIASLDPTDVDVLIAAGDIGTKSNIEKSLVQICRRYKQVIYVAGNHEFWGHKKTEVETTIQELVAGLPNLHWLNSSSVTVDGQRFVGGTLWFRDDPMNFFYAKATGFGDFERIEELLFWVYQESDKLREFLEKELVSSDVVVTHHLPSHACVPQGYTTSQINRFFVNPLDGLIAERSPKLWLHGHTHHSLDFLLGDTRIVCNPFGYVGRELNTGFDQKKLIEF